MIYFQYLRSKLRTSMDSSGYLFGAFLVFGLWTNSVADTQEEHGFDSPDLEFIKSVISRQFYIKDLEFRSDVKTTYELVEYLQTSRVDPWSAIEKRSTGYPDFAIRRNGYGLRVLKFNRSLFYLLPEIGSPNEGNSFKIYQTLNWPVDGNWTGAMEAGEVRLSDTRMFFKSASYLAQGIRIESTRVRIDDFLNPSLPTIFKEREKELAQVNLVDLRFNSGGRVDLAAQFARLLIGVDLPLGTIERRGEHTPIGSPVLLSKEEMIGVRERARSLVILVSRFTASSAEWLARNLQIYGATVLGERSTGKCLIHSSFAIGEGHFVKLAVGRLHVVTDARQHRWVLYDYCEFGLIPDRWIDGRLLIEQSAAWFVESIK